MAGLLGRMRELASDHGYNTLIKIDRFLTAKGTGSAEILTLILLDQFANERCLFLRSVRVLQPGFERLCQMISDNLLDFQTASGKEGQQLAERQRAGMRGVAQLFKVILVSSAGGKLAGDQVLNHDRSLQLADPRHLAKHAPGFFAVMKGIARDDNLKGIRGKWEVLGIALLEMQGAEAPLLAHLLSQRERGRGKIESHNFAAGFCKGGSDIAGAGCHIQDTRPPVGGAPPEQEQPDDQGWQ